MIVGGVLVFVIGVFVGFLLGRAGREEEATAALPSPSASPSDVAVPSAGGSPPVVTPPPGQEPAITAAGQILVEGTRPVVTAPSASPCQGLISAGMVGECGEVAVAAGRVVWVVQRSTTSTGATALQARVFTFVPDEGGWVEWLQASDPAGDLWSDVNVLATDLTADGVPELIFGYRGIDESQTLDTDIVGYGQDGLPVVVAHPEPAVRGVLVVSGGQIQVFGAQYPNGEPVCCPPSYLQRTIAFEDGFFRVVASQSVAPNVVPASQL